jgi:O-antigen/teichoic acid export membrane protein
MGRLLQEGAAVATGQILSACGTLVGLRVLTEVAPPAVYGSFVLIVGAILLLQSLFLLPVAQGALRYYAEAVANGTLEQLRSVFIRKVVRTTAVVAVLTVIVCIGGTVLADWPMLLGPIIAITFFIEGLRTLQINFANAARRQGEYATMMAFDGWFRPLGAAAGAALVPNSVSSMLAGQLMATAIIVASFIPAQRLELAALLKSIPGPQAEAISESMKEYSKPLVPAAFIAWASGLADRYIVGGIAGISEAGSYAAAYGLVSRPFLMLSGLVEAILRQPMYEAVAQQDASTEQSILRAWRLSIFWLGMPGLILILLFSDWLASIFIAKEYLGVSSFMPWIATGYFFLALSQSYERVCYAHHATKLVLVIQGVGGTLSILLATIGTWVAGAWGAAVAVPIYFGLQSILARRMALVARRSKES